MPKKRKRRPGTPPRRSPAASAPAAPAASRALAGTDLSQQAPARAPSAPDLTGGPGRAPRPERLTVTGAGRLEVTSVSCSPLEGLDPQGLGLTYWFEAPGEGGPFVATVDFTGRRLGVEGQRGPGDAFTARALVDPVLAGSGRIAVTARVTDIAPGEWEVSASAALSGGPSRARLPEATGRGATAFAPVVRVQAPGVRLGAWPFMVALGAGLGLALQAFLAVRRDEPAVRLFLLTLLACVIGTAGAKVYYVVTHREEKAGLRAVGMSVQGFVLGCIGTLVLGSLATGISVGTTLDLSAPGLLLGMTVGRIGCFLGGCCAGKPTASRWGLWSSDRRLGLRRIPVQLMESTMAGAVLLATLLVVLRVSLPADGLAFVGGIAAYVFGRQVLFPLRDLPRKTRHGRLVTMVVAGAVLLGDVAAVLAS